MYFVLLSDLIYHFIMLVAPPISYTLEWLSYISDFLWLLLNNLMSIDTRKHWCIILKYLAKLCLKEVDSTNSTK